MLRVFERHTSNSRSFTSIKELFYSIDGILSLQICDTDVLYLQDAVPNTQKFPSLERIKTQEGRRKKTSLEKYSPLT